jgi:ferredoxin/flavodoxin---NADP+ reductase
MDTLSAGRRLYLLCTGTGVAPFASIARDPETYERFESVALVHGAEKLRKRITGFRRRSVDGG